MLWRKFLFWEWYTDTNCKIVFLHCLLKANGEDKEWKGMIIKRGQFFTSIDHLSDELSLTSKQIRIALDKLEKGEEITTKGASKGTMITVCKYDTYQDYGQAEGQTKGEQSGKQRATTNYSILFNTVIDSNKIILNDEFKSLFLEWLKYKSEKRQSYKEIGLKNFLIKSLRDCGNDPEVLREMMLFSIANNYDGLFKERKNGFNKKDLGATPAEIAGSVGKYFASDRER